MKIVSIIPVFGYHPNLPILIKNIDYISKNCKNFKNIIFVNDNEDLTTKVDEQLLVSSLLIQYNFNFNVYGCINKCKEIFPDVDLFWFHDQDSYPINLDKWICFFDSELDLNKMGVLSPLKYDENKIINRLFYLNYVNRIGLFDVLNNDIKRIRKSNVFGHAGNMLNTKLLPIRSDIIEGGDLGDFYYCIKSILLGYKNKVVELDYIHPNLEVKNNLGVFKSKKILLPSNGISLHNQKYTTPYIMLYKRLNLILPLLYIYIVIFLKELFK